MSICLAAARISGVASPTAWDDESTAPLFASLCNKSFANSTAFGDGLSSIFVFSSLVETTSSSSSFPVSSSWISTFVSVVIGAFVNKGFFNSSSLFKKFCATKSKESSDVGLILSSSSFSFFLSSPKKADDDDVVTVAADFVLRCCCSCCSFCSLSKRFFFSACFSARTNAIVVAVISSASCFSFPDKTFRSPCFSLNKTVAASNNFEDGFSTSPSSAKNSFVSLERCCSLLFCCQLRLGIIPRPAVSRSRPWEDEPVELVIFDSSISLSDGILISYFSNSALSSSRNNPFLSSSKIIACPAALNPNRRWLLTRSFLFSWLPLLLAIATHPSVTNVAAICQRCCRCLVDLVFLKAAASSSSSTTESKHSRSSFACLVYIERCVFMIVSKRERERFAA